MPKIAVEHPFTDIQLALEKRGYQADMFDQKEKASQYDVLVVRNSESYDHLSFQGSLVEVSGRTVNEIVDEVEERLQRAGKIPGEPDAAKSKAGSGFFAGLLSGAAIGSAVALLLAPKSGKELQVTVKEKLASRNSESDGSGKLSQVKEKAADLANQAKEKATEATTQVKEKVSGSSKEEQKTETVKETDSASSEDKKN
ncbi:YkuS family protein [Planococcus shenhongbingii]|uniref:YkuS family protein n=1 Tax=Planococcus shenhongbingii TaxID=3058398 RepID=UPI002634F5F4|nr:YkuS family protein [Planococcus sp. N016]WKA59288.1 YkuS family protein [Planococcus sp. N016]